MPKFMDVHDGFVGVTEAQLIEAHHEKAGHPAAEIYEVPVEIS